ncbi:hypothetical protein PPACK8108_LOCUS2983 [Phakopsora pachyrhizi]|uniref:Malate synthase N-terminal domain-containing protein n=1 Tax=Phakopsora pachyrhizi TaxID=170000 RepID=A0AAV0AMW5_PHAPC|nr:hypothetical protein PPACK8108_LOCUS2983 [Phakopsora pachyrhizi]
MSLTTSVLGVKLLQEVEKVHQSILTPEAIKFLATLHCYFEPTRRCLLQLRQLQQALLDAGGLLDFNPQTSWIREDLTWKAASPAPGLVMSPCVNPIPTCQNFHSSIFCITLD